MIIELQKQIRDLLPLVVKNSGCEGYSFHLAGDDWSFSAMTSWRLIKESKIIFSSNVDEENLEKFCDILTNQIVNVTQQSSLTPYDPTFYFANGFQLEIFSPRSYDTWVFNIQENIGYVFNAVDYMIPKNDVFNGYSEIQDLYVEEFVENLGILTLSGKHWSLEVKSSWRIINEKGEFTGCYEKVKMPELTNIVHAKILGIKPQSILLPIDPIFFFSNGSRLEVFTESPDASWELKLPSGKIVTSLMQGAVPCDVRFLS